MASSLDPQPLVPKSLRLSQETLTELSKLAPIEGRSRNNLIIKILREGLTKRKREKSNG